MENHGQKRSAEESSDLLEGIRAVVCDIEGTTTPITFVKDKLFPYIRENVQSYLESHWENEETQADVQALRDQATTDKEVDGCVSIPEEGEQADVIKALVSSVKWQMDLDKKTTALKSLQGHMWREAYKTKKVQGEVYDDVVPALKNWVNTGLKVYIYSSGSVEAQKLLFGYSDKGDLLDIFSGNYDTNIGAKQEKDSYSAIASDMGVGAGEILFLTDIPAEATAANEAGMKTAVVIREGNKELTDEEKQTFNTISSFSEISGDVDGPAKRAEPEGNGAAEEDGDSVDSAEGDVVDDDDLDDDDVVDEEDGDEEEEEAADQ